LPNDTLADSKKQAAPDAARFPNYPIILYFIPFRQRKYICLAGKNFGGEHTMYFFVSIGATIG